jgi:universal stress protein A
MKKAPATIKKRLALQRDLITAFNRSTHGAGISTILIPVDFTDYSKVALSFAVSLSRTMPSRLVVLHVVDFYLAGAIDPRFDYIELTDELRQEAVEKLNKLVKRLGRAARVQVQLRQGRAWKTICDTARDAKADFIVMGTHGATGLAHVFLGSTAEKVVRHAPCAVLVVPLTVK